MEKRTTDTGILNISYLDEGPKDAPVVMLLHGWPDDATAWLDVAPSLLEAGFRTIIPWLRGSGLTRFLSPSIIRDGRAVALAQDVIDLADQLGLDAFAVAGHDWGARVAYTLAGLYPERITHIAALALAFQPNGVFRVPSFQQSRLFWYQWLMGVDAGAEAVKADPVGFARIMWETWSPTGWFSEADFNKAAESFRNPDWVAITLHAYRSRFKWEAVDPRYDPLQQQLGVTDKLHIPTLMIHGGADTCDEPSSSEGLDHHFTAGYQRIVLDGIGHFPMREAPEEIAGHLLKHFS